MFKDFVLFYFGFVVVVVVVVLVCMCEVVNFVKKCNRVIKSGKERDVRQSPCKFHLSRSTMT